MLSVGRSISIKSLCYLVCFCSRWGLIVGRRAGLLNYIALMSVVKLPSQRGGRC